MEVNVEHLGSLQFEIKARGHAIVSDQPVAEGGFDEGIAPPEMLLAALDGCAAFYAAQYLRKHKLAMEGTHVRVSCDKVKDPNPRLSNFVVVVETPVELSNQQRQGVQDAVDRCLVKNTLLHPPSISVAVETLVSTPERD